jgi:hypothetical protein
MATITINTQPISTAYIVGDAITLIVVASISPPGGTLAYQWYKETVVLAGKTLATLAINPAAITDAGSYTCVVSCAGAADATSIAAVLELDSIVAAICRNRKAALAAITTAGGAYSFLPAKIEEERLFLEINNRYPYILILKAPIEPQEEDDHREKVNIQFMVCCFDIYNDETETSDEITVRFRNYAADITRAWMADRTCKGTRALGLMEGTRKLGEDQGVAVDNKGNQIYRVDVVFEVFGFIDSDNPFLKG